MTPAKSPAKSPATSPATPPPARRSRPRLPRPRAGTPATALFLGALAVSALTAPLIEPASAQSAASAIDQPTPATVARPRTDGTVAPPRALKPTTAVTGTGGTVDPTAHLPRDMRRGD